MPVQTVQDDKHDKNWGKKNKRRRRYSDVRDMVVMKTKSGHP